MFKKRQFVTAENKRDSKHNKFTNVWIVKSPIGTNRNYSKEQRACVSKNLLSVWEWIWAIQRSHLLVTTSLSFSKPTKARNTLLNVSSDYKWDRDRYLCQQTRQRLVHEFDCYPSNNNNNKEEDSLMTSINPGILMNFARLKKKAKITFSFFAK